MEACTGKAHSGLEQDSRNDLSVKPKQERVSIWKNKPNNRSSWTSSNLRRESLLPPTDNLATKASPEIRATACSVTKANPATRAAIKSPATPQQQGPWVAGETNS